MYYRIEVNTLEINIVIVLNIPRSEVSLLIESAPISRYLRRILPLDPD